MDKTKDLQDAIETYLATDGLALTQGALFEALLEDHPSLRDDPRWIMVALVHLKRAGRIWYPDCDSGHNHGEDCVLKWVIR